MKATQYEVKLIELMRDYNLTLREAINRDLDLNGVDKGSVLGLCDYMEEQLKNDMNRVEYYMAVYTEQSPDVMLRKLDQQ
jgi:hypothetical protein